MKKLIRSTSFLMSQNPKNSAAISPCLTCYSICQARSSALDSRGLQPTHLAGRR